MEIAFIILIVRIFVIETARFLILTIVTSHSHESPVMVKICLDHTLAHHLVDIHDLALGRIHIGHKIEADVVAMQEALEKHL